MLIIQKLSHSSLQENQQQQTSQKSNHRPKLFIEFFDFCASFGILHLHINMTVQIKFLWLFLSLLMNISSIIGKTFCIPR